MNREPAVIIGSVVALVDAALIAIVAFGVDLTKEQTAAVMGVASGIATLIGAYVTRGKVWSPESVEEAIDEATALPPMDLPVVDDTPVDLDQVARDAGLD